MKNESKDKNDLYKKFTNQLIKNFNRICLRRIIKHVEKLKKI